MKVVVEIPWKLKDSLNLIYKLILLWNKVVYNKCINEMTVP